MAKRGLFALLVVVGLLMATIVPAAAAGGTPFDVVEAVQGEIGWLTLNQGRQEVCFDFNEAGFGPGLTYLANIHEVGGAVAVHLYFYWPSEPGFPPIPSDGPDPRGCKPADRDLIKAIRHNPGGYYVQLTSRWGQPLVGQLSK